MANIRETQLQVECEDTCYLWIGLWAEDRFRQRMGYYKKKRKAKKL